MMEELMEVLMGGLDDTREWMDWMSGWCGWTHNMTRVNYCMAGGAAVEVNGRALQWE